MGCIGMDGRPCEYGCIFIQVRIDELVRWNDERYASRHELGRYDDCSRCRICIHPLFLRIE